jgi:NAD(P)-dependent dehydrogenase (short-subunit alcohol dehydrogenase family)
MAKTIRTALVTGGNRGIGLATCRALGRAGLRVVVGARDSKLGEAAADELRGEGLDALCERLDVSDEKSVESCARRLAKAGLAIDALVNNAGVYEQGALFSMTTEALRRSLDTNFYGAFWTARAFFPGMRDRRYGRIVNVTSGYGLFSEGLQGPPAYSVSKAALDALTLKLAQEAPPGVKVNAACPGWVRTRMGGEGAPLTPEEGADTLAWLAALPDDGPSGQVFRRRRALAW